MRYRVRHDTVYSYGNDVVHSHQLLHLVPRPTPYQQCLEHSLIISPGNYSRRDETDAFGNPITRVEFEDAHRRLEVSTQMEVEVHPRPPVAAADTLPWEQVRQLLSYGGGWPAREVLDACRFRHESPYVRVKQVFKEYGADCFTRERPVLACAQALMEKLHREFKYAPGETSIATPLSEVLETRRGVCQDFAHLMIACFRARGLAARYVSGYIRLRPASTVVQPDENCSFDGMTFDEALQSQSLGGMEQTQGDLGQLQNDLEPVQDGMGQVQAGVGQVQRDVGQAQGGVAQRNSDVAGSSAQSRMGEAEDEADAQLDWVGAGASHAWVSVYIPPFGWLELDPTNNVYVGTDHVSVAWGRDFGDVSPLRGVILGGGSHQLSVCVTVEPLYGPAPASPAATH